MKLRKIGILYTALLFLTTSSTLLQASEESGFQHNLSIYGWLPSMDGTLKYKIPGEDTEPDSEVESGIADTLDSVFMGSYEVRKNKWSFLVDMIYLKMSASQDAIISTPKFSNIPDIHVGAEQELTAWLFGFYGGYNLIDSNNFKLDAMGGLRYLSLGVDLSFSLNNKNKTFSPSIENYDGVIGIQGAYTINEDWYIPYGFDIGGGDSDLTWQASMSVGYMFDWGDILLTYRYLHYDFGKNKFVNDFDLYGPKLGLVFHF